MYGHQVLVNRLERLPRNIVDRAVKTKNKQTVEKTKLNEYKTVTYELRHDKTNKMSVHPAKTQISLSS